MPAAPAGMIKSCVMPAGMNSSFIKDQCIDFHDFILNDQKHELDLDFQYIHHFLYQT